MQELLTPSHEAMNQVLPEIDSLRREHDLGGDVQLLAAERFDQAGMSLKKIEDVVGNADLDEAVVDYLDHAEATAQDSPVEYAEAISIGIQEVYAHPDSSNLTALELQTVPPYELGEALRDVALVKGDEAVEKIIEYIEDVGTGVPEFDALDDYSPEFSGQLLLHRSNAELNPGDIILPSEQVSDEMHSELNDRRSIRSTSSPKGSGGYDRKLAHAGTRDYGKVYGENLYTVEPIDGDTLKWGENFGMPNFRHKRAVSRAIDRSAVGKVDPTGVDPSKGKFASTDSFTEKQFNEVVSTRGFRVVEKVNHEPAYEEAMLPWPISTDAIDTHEARRKNELVGVMHDAGHIITNKIDVNSRKRPSKIGARDAPGTYRAGAHNQVPANLQNTFDLRKQQAEYPGQMALPEMPLAKFRVKHEVPSAEVQPYARVLSDQEDTPLPGLEDTSPKRPMV